MNKLEQAARQALNYLENSHARFYEEREKAITALREALDNPEERGTNRYEGWVEVAEQAEQEPVAWVDLTDQEKWGAYCRHMPPSEDRKYIFDAGMSAGIKLFKEKNTAPQPVSQEPVYWEVLNGVCSQYICKTKERAEEVCFDKQKSHDLSGSLASFNIRPLYTRPIRTKDPCHPWQDLTDEEIGSIYEKHHALGGCWTDGFAYERAVIAADRELNK